MEVYHRSGRVVEFAQTFRAWPRLFERLADVVSSASELLSEVRERLGDIADRASRDRLLTEIAGVGMRGAAAALAMGDVASALRLLEEGRAQQMGARLREMEAVLAPDDHTRLDAARGDLAHAEIAVIAAQEAFGAAHANIEQAKSESERQELGGRRLAARGRLDAAARDLGEVHTVLSKMKAELGLDDLTVPLPDPGALRAALGDAALVQAVSGRDGGWLLLLAPGTSGWQVHPVPGLTPDMVKAVTNDYFRHVGRFAAGRVPDGEQPPESEEH